jgi:hypothetical protein
MLAGSQTAILCNDVFHAEPAFIAPDEEVGDGSGRDGGEPCELRCNLSAAFSAVWVSLVFMI